MFKVQITVLLTSVKVRLRYGENSAKQVRFKEQQNTVCFFKTLSGIFAIV